MPVLTFRLALISTWLLVTCFLAPGVIQASWQGQQSLAAIIQGLKQF